MGTSESQHELYKREHHFVVGTERDDVLNAKGYVGVNAKGGDDLLNVTATDGTTQAHIYGGSGADTINLSFANIVCADAHGHHVFLEGVGYEGHGSDTVNFQDLGNIKEGGIVVGRIEEFVYSSDVIQIEGQTVDLKDLPATVNGHELRVVRYDGDFDDPNTVPQQWLLIETSGGGTAFYALDGARIDMDGPELDGRENQETHFIRTTPDFDTLVTVDYVDPHNYVPDEFQYLDAGGGKSVDGGVFVNDDDNFRDDVNENILGTRHNDVIAGGLNGDTIVSANGDDMIWGGDGHDNIMAGSGDDYIEGNNGDDRIVAAYGDDTVYGGHGNDTIYGGAGDDVLIGGSGDDMLDVGSGIAGDDSIQKAYGGLGDDLYQIRDDVEEVLIRDVGRGNDTINFAETNFADWDITYETNENGTTDIVFTSVDDTDIVRVRNNTDGEVAVVEQYQFKDGLWEIEDGQLVESDDNEDDKGYNVIKGGARADDINGTGEADHIIGRGGDDTIEGQGGDDWINGGAGNDRLYGGDGDDRLVVGQGTEDGNGQGAFGGDGDDTYVHSTGSEKLILDDFGNGNDTLVFTDTEFADWDISYRDKAGLTFVDFNAQESDDIVRVRNFENEDRGLIENYKFTDGTYHFIDGELVEVEDADTTEADLDYL